MTEMPGDRLLFREAADLAIRLQNDPTNPVAAETVRAWVARSPGHTAAWARVAEIHGMTGKVLAGQHQHSSAGKAMSRRNLVVGAVLGFGAAGAGIWGLPRAIRHAQADYTTSTGEIRSVALPDGSVMTLGPDSAATIDYTAAGRRIELLSGMAYFEVSPDASRPFTVASGRVSAVAVGTAFDVSSDAGFVSISVNQGVVETRASDSTAIVGQRLKAGDWVTLDPAGGHLERGTREPFQIAAWRAGMLVAERETVSAMVVKIARWQPGTVVIADPSIGGRLVSGVFDLGDPSRALDAVVRPFGARVRRVGSLTVISPF